MFKLPKPKKSTKNKNIFAGVGISKADDPFTAGKEAVEIAIKEMQSRGGKQPNFGLVFCSGGKYGKNDKTIRELVNGAHSVFSEYNCKWVGCTTSGEITPKGIEHGSVVVCAISTEYIRFGVGVGENLSENPKEAGKKAVKRALDDITPDKYVDAYIRYLATKTKKPSELIKQRQFAILTLPAGFTLKKSGWEDRMLDGIKEIVGDYTPIIGGSAGDDFKMIKNYQFANGKAYEDSIVCTAIFSNLKLGFGLAHGFEPTDKIALVTKAEGNTVYELNHRPAVDVYAELLGVKKEELLKGMGFLKIGEKLPILTFKFFGKVMKTEEIMKKISFFKFMMENPFGIPDISGNFWMKIPKRIKENKYLEFYSKIPQNLPLTLMQVSKEKSIKATADAVKQSLKDIKAPGLVMIFECAGRLAYLLEKLPKSQEIVRHMLKNIPFLGFYTNGEQGFTKNMPSGHHSYTCIAFSIDNRLITQK